jgi:hypothetical protein
MKRTFIAATFGGVLAAGFLTVSAPVAHAYPLCDRYVGQFQQNCETVCAEQSSNQAGMLSGWGPVPAAPGSGQWLQGGIGTVGNPLQPEVSVLADAVHTIGPTPALVFVFLFALAKGATT